MLLATTYGKNTPEICVALLQFVDVYKLGLGNPDNLTTSLI